MKPQHLDSEKRQTSAASKLPVSFAKCWYLRASRSCRNVTRHNANRDRTQITLVKGMWQNWLVYVMLDQGW